MKDHAVRVYLSKESLPKEEQLAFKLAQMAVDTLNTSLDKDVEDMIINRFIDNYAVAGASVNRDPIIGARGQALGFQVDPAKGGATVVGLPNDVIVSPQWAAWVNGVAVRELDFHDTYLAADYSHPADNIPPILAVAQHFRIAGERLLRAVQVAYEIHMALVKSICLHKYKKDHIAHLCPAQAAGVGVLLGLSVDEVYQAIQQAVHVSFSTRQSRKGEISSWKAFAPAHAGKLAIEAVDRAMRGLTSPSPIYEGEDSVMAYMLNNESYTVSLPEVGESRRAIMESYTKEHSAEYQAQALIDLAFDLRKQIQDFSDIEEVLIHTSHHTHYVIGTGSGDTQKMDPQASRETLDHSIMYIFAVALEDGFWHHISSYTPERAQRPETVKLWHKVRTAEDPKWTEAYHHTDPDKKCFGGRVEIKMKDGTVISGELARANAHISGARPFQRPNYLDKFNTMTEGLVSSQEKDRFLSLVESLPSLSGEQVRGLNLVLEKVTPCERKGIFN